MALTNSYEARGTAVVGLLHPESSRVYLVQQQLTGLQTIHIYEVQGTAVWSSTDSGLAGSKFRIYSSTSNFRTPSVSRVWVPHTEYEMSCIYLRQHYPARIIVYTYIIKQYYILYTIVHDRGRSGSGLVYLQYIPKFLWHSSESSMRGLILDICLSLPIAREQVQGECTAVQYRILRIRITRTLSVYTPIRRIKSAYALPHLAKENLSLLKWKTPHDQCLCFIRQIYVRIIDLGGLRDRLGGGMCIIHTYVPGIILYIHIICI